MPNDIQLLLISAIVPVGSVLFALSMLWFSRPKNKHPRLHPGE